MRKHYAVRMLRNLVLVPILWLAAMGTVQGQITKNRDSIKVDPSGFPADVKKGYRLFGMKCGECHSLDTSLKPSMSASQWTFEVKRMQAMASSQFDDAQAKAILGFLNYYEAHRESPNTPAAQAEASGTGGAGRQFYDTQGCATCHAVGGKGGAAGPSLSGVGKRLSKDQLTEVIQGMRTGKSSMPPLPKETTDQQVKDLVDFLASLNNEPQGQKTGTQKKPETQTGQGSEPAAQAESSGTEPKPASQAVPSGTVAGGGRQFYDTQGCATCHAIGGKGGTAGPSLSDVGKRLSRDQLAEVIQKMREGKSSMPPLPKETTDQQAKDLTDFLATLNNEPERQNGGAQKKLQAPTDEKPKPVAQAGALGTAAAGRQFYDKQGCATCHAIAGKGGTSGPSLSDVGKRLSTEQLTEVIRKGKSSMPPLPAGTTDQQVKDLVDFLVSPNNKASKQTAGVQKGAETPKGQGSKPAVQAEPSGPVAAAGLLTLQPGEELAKLRAADTNGPTALPGILLLFLIAVSAILIGVLVFRPGLTATPGGKILAFFVLFLLPLIAAGIGTTYQIDRSKSTKFCLSCHEMEPFGRSLLVDDSAHLAAAHFQNHRVPADEACYTCHTNYAMFGGFRAKIGGLKHVYIHYLGKVPAPEAIRLYDPFNNRECLHCHLGARSFEEGATHNANPYLLPAVKGNQVSCLSCHQTVHNIAQLNQAKFWKGNP